MVPLSHAGATWHRPTPRSGLEHLEDDGAEGEDHLHAHLPADLPGRLARHGAGRRRAGADRLLRQSGEGRRCSGCTTCSWAAASPARRFSRSGIMPYISASIFMQIGAAVIPQLDKMQKEEEGRKRITQWTRYVTVALAIVQGWGFALFTEACRARREPGPRVQDPDGVRSSRRARSS